MRSDAVQRCGEAFRELPADHRVWRRVASLGTVDAFSAHGYLGKEAEAVEQVVNWMLKKPFLHEVK